MHDVLSNRCRRTILYYLQDHDTPVPLTVVARHLLVWYGACAVRWPHATPLVRQLRSWLLQAHIVEMETLGIIGYDAASDTVWIPDDVTISVTSPGAPAGKELWLKPKRQLSRD